MALYNLASKFVPLVDERFTAESFATGVCGANYTFDGNNTIIIPSVATVPMNDYDRHGLNGSGSRYGTPVDLQASVQKLDMKRDRSFSFIVDRLDNMESQNIVEANQALSRQLNEVAIPEYDRHVFNTLAATASTAGNFSATKAAKKTASTEAKAYDLFLEAQEWLGDHLVPDEGRVAVCSYAMATALKQDPAFVLASEAGMDIREKGVIGMVDGVKIKRVPSNRLPIGCAAIITHPYASVAPERLKDYKIHDNPPGINGWLVEGRVGYDAFVLNNKMNSIYYIGMDGVSRIINIVTTPDYQAGFATTKSKKATLVIQDYEKADASGNAITYYYRVTAQPSQPAYSSFSVGTGATKWNTMTGPQLSGIEAKDGAGAAIVASRVFVEVVGVVGTNVVAYGSTILNLYDEI